MFRISASKFYYKLSNNILSSYLNYMKPSLPVFFNCYGTRSPKFQLPPVKHAFAEQMVQYSLFNLLNIYIYIYKDALDIINCIQQLTFLKVLNSLKIWHH